MAAFEPAYRELLHSGELKQRVSQAYERLEACDLCAWECGINRRSGKMGVCRSGQRARVCSYGAHMGEEDPLRGWRGSGTVFFARCNLRCQYCQNYDISQADSGEEIEPEALASIMLELQQHGCHNINFVSPSHVVAPILAAVLIAAQAGLRIPLVYNTGGYDSLIALKLLDSVIDIYMPDMKYADPRIARRYSKIPHYPSINRAAVHEMHRQTGDLQIDTNGIAQRGLLVRHLVLPNDLAGSREILRFLAEEISINTYINIMDQYHPAYKAHQYPELNRRITRDEYRSVLQMAENLGLHRLDQRRGWLQF